MTQLLTFASLVGLKDGVIIHDSCFIFHVDVGDVWVLDAAVVGCGGGREVVVVEDHPRLQQRA